MSRRPAASGERAGETVATAMTSMSAASPCVPPLLFSARGRIIQNVRFSEFSELPSESSEMAEVARRAEAAEEARRIEAARRAEAADRAAAAERAEAERAAAKREAERGLEDARADYSRKKLDRAASLVRTRRLVENRAGDHRPDSLRKLQEEGRRLDDLLAEHETGVRDAAGKALPGATDSQIRRARTETTRMKAELQSVEKHIQQEAAAEEAHTLRIPGFADLKLDSMKRAIVTKAARAVATVAAHHILPGLGAPVVRGVEMIWTACAAPQKVADGNAVKIGVPVSIMGGLIELDIGTTLSDSDILREGAPLAFELGWNLDGPAGVPSGAGSPQIEVVVESAGQEPKPGVDEPDKQDEPDEHEEMEEQEEQGQVAPADKKIRSALEDGGLTEARPEADGRAGGHAGPAPETPAHPRSAETVAEAPGKVAGPESHETGRVRFSSAEETGESGPLPRTSRPAATGVVIWGPARMITAAARRPSLSAEVLVSYAREGILRQTCDGTAGSVASAMRKARNLEIVVFLDPEIGGGLWIDVDPVSQAPAAALAVQMTLSSSGLEEFLLLQAGP